MGSKVEMFAIIVVMAICPVKASMTIGADTFVSGAGVITATAEPVPVDLRIDGVVGVFGTVNLRYSPLWAASGASVRIETVVGSVTNVIKSGAVGEEGTFAWIRPDEATPLYKLLLWTMREGNAVGSPQEAMISFGIRSASDIVTAADTLTNSLELVLSSGSLCNLAYSTMWAEDASMLEISTVRLSGRGGAPMATNTIFSVAGDAEGVAPMCGVSMGYWRLLCRIFDSSGEVALEYLTGEFRRKGGTVLCFR